MAVHQEVIAKGQTLLRDAQKKHADGLISDETLAVVAAEWRSDKEGDDL